MSAELTTAFPQNGGYVLWVSAAFGAGAGEMAGWLQFVSSAVDLCLYPGLFVVYLQQMLDANFTSEEAWALKSGFIVLLLLLNLLGIEQVGHGSLVFMSCLLTPFIFITLVTFTGASSGVTVLGWHVEGGAMLGSKQEAVDWPGFLMVLLWNMGSFECASVCAGEVSNAAIIFPQAIVITVVVVMSNYVLPIMAFCGLDSDYGHFDNGHYISVARAAGGEYLGVALGAAQTAAVAGLFANGLVTNSYLVCGMSEQGLLPARLSARLPKTKAPWLAILMTFGVIVVTMPLKQFKTILGVDMVLYCVALLLEIAAFLRLRFSQPHLDRAFRIPVEGAWLLLLYLPMTLITAAGVILGGWTELVVAAAFVGVGAMLIAALSWVRERRPDWFTVAQGVQPAMTQGLSPQKRHPSIRLLVPAPRGEAGCPLAALLIYRSLSDATRPKPDRPGKCIPPTDPLASLQDLAASMTAGHWGADL